MIEVTICPRCEAKTYKPVFPVIKVNDFDYDLACFGVYNHLNKHVANVYPNSVEDMIEISKALKSGKCPLCDNWEDGLGRTLGHGIE